MKDFDIDDISANPSRHETLTQLQGRFSRRRFLAGGLGGGAVSFLGGMLPVAQALAASGSVAGTAIAPMLGFKAVSMSTADTVVVPEGYAHAVIKRWGDPLHAGAPVFRGDASDDGAAQEQQVGYNHDGMHFFPIDGKDGASGSGTEGVSVTHMRLDAQGQWQLVADSAYNRSIHANTAIDMVGPSAGHALLQTQADPSGRQARGTFGNCGNGWTPWNTYLTCEENFTDYFGVGKQDETAVDYPDAAYRAHMQRYKGGGKGADPEYAWDLHDARFDWTQEPNEYNRHGWIVEIDPFDPKAAPRKLTALGRFKHENAALMIAPDGHVVVYMGDDQRSEYLYRFVSDQAFRAGDTAHNRQLLEQGTLYVARFDAGADGQGVGRWIPLVLDTKAADGRRLGDLFNDDMGELLIKTRQAADAVGATPMDRPEWVAVHPDRREAYVTLTNNSQRGSGKPRWPGGPAHPGVDAANPRAKNIYGQIVRWREAGSEAANQVFTWDIFLLAGNPGVYDQNDPRRGSGNVTPDNMFNSPDGLGFDPQGRLWIQTDGKYDNSGEYAGQGNNQMLVADPVSASRWPDGAQATRPRPATVVIWKQDGGIIGS